MDRENELYFNELVKEYNKSIENLYLDLILIWKQVIEELVYYREPSVYERTYQLRDKFKVELIGNTLYAYVDTDSMNYYNSKGNVDGEKVVHWIDVGHNAGSSPFGEEDYFWNYPARHIIEEYANRVKTKYPEFEMEIHRDTFL